MRHKYETRGIVLARRASGERDASLTILTEDLGLLHARAGGVRLTKSKLAHALVTFAHSELTLVSGKDGWRVAGAVLRENWFARLPAGEPRRRAARITGLLLRLSPTEAPETALYPLMEACLAALCREDAGEGAELLAAAALLAALGFCESDAAPSFADEMLTNALAERSRYVALINRGIEASGL